MNNKQCLDILLQNEYLISALSSHKRMPDTEDDLSKYPYCIVTLPKKILGEKFEETYYVYSIQHDKSSLVVEHWTLNDNTTDLISKNTIKMPLYAIRLYILTHLLCLLKKYQYSSELVRYIYDDQEVEGKELDNITDFFNKIYAPDDSENLKLEQKLQEIFILSFKNGLKQEYNSIEEVKEGYILLSNLYRETFGD